MSNREGGNDWEDLTAWELVLRGREEKNIKMERLGWTRWSEAQTNKLSSIMADKLTPMLLELQGIRGDQGKVSRKASRQLESLLKSAREDKDLIASVVARLGVVEAIVLSFKIDHQTLVTMLEALTELDKRVKALENESE